MALSGCLNNTKTSPPPAGPIPITIPTEAEKPAASPPKPPAPIMVNPSENSQELAEYYRNVQQDLLVQGLLRTDGGGVDTPYTDTDLVEDFIAIAFYDEYSQNEGLIRSSGEEVGLTKWTTPVRIRMEFGKSVDKEIRKKDRAELERYAKRLSRVTGHPITISNKSPNFYVLVMSEDDRMHLVKRIKEVMPETSPAALSAIADLPRSIHCLVVTFSSEDRRSQLRQSIALIRAEHPDLTRKACIHEEVAQGLGLTNDSPHARPSIFNDDDEFAYLTTHDEDLLRILYSPELKPGMSIKEATPIVRKLARRLKFEGS